MLSCFDLYSIVVVLVMVYFCYLVVSFVVRVMFVERFKFLNLLFGVKMWFSIYMC